MTIGDTTTTNTVNSYTDATQSINNALGKDAFLELLITQIRFQDPLKPLEDREFIAQLAQFSSLEQIQQVNENLSVLAQMDSTAQAASLLDKQVTGYDETGEILTGRVESILFEEGLPWLLVNGTKLSPANVMLIEP